MAWVNTNDSAVSISSLAQGAVSLPICCWGISRCVPSRLTPIARGCLCTDRQTAICPGSPSGTTCEPSTEHPGTDTLISCQEASPVSPGASQEPARELRITATSGPIPSGWFVQYDHITSSWRTSQGSLLTLTLDVFSETWPKQGTMHAGVCWEQMTWAHPTAEDGSGYWLPTPTAHQGGWNQGGGNGREGQPIRPSLEHMARHNLWKTPTAEDCRDRAFARNNRGEPKLSAQVKMIAPWATPTAHPRTHTPRQVDHGQQLANQVGGSLNPTWVEWLMGWCLGWTALEPLAMDKYQQWLQQHGAFFHTE